MDREQGTLYLVATPIGNLEDITYRAVRILSEVDLVAAEDTRHSLKLLNHLQIKKPLISYHDNNRLSRAGELVARLKNGENIALVSDAGMPAISDPGEELVRMCAQESIRVTVVPGCNAALAGLVLSGLSTKRFALPTPPGRLLLLLPLDEHETSYLAESANICSLSSSFITLPPNKQTYVLIYYTT